MSNKPEYSLEIDGKQVAHDGTTPIDGPGVLELHAPGGIFEPAYMPDAPRKEQRDYTSVVDENLVICYECVHYWGMWKYAPVQNVKPDGSPYREREGYCLLPATLPGGAPLPMSERYVLTCNQFQRVADAIESRSIAMGHVAVSKESSNV